MIRLATLQDIPRILEIKNLAIDTMHQNKIFQWDDSYPTQDIFEQDILRKEFYVLEEHNHIMGFCCINNTHAPEHKQLNWSTPGDAYMVHRLAIDPNAGGKGFASLFLAFAEQLAKSNNVFSMRINTFSHNYLAQKLFIKNGYSYVGEMIIPRKTEPFYCYEKHLNP